MVRMLKTYTQEFKDEAVQFALKSENVNQAAISLGIPIGTLYAWVEKAKKSSVQVVADANGVVNHVNVKNLIDENRELKKRLSRLEEEKAILKKAATYFAQELK
jgi:transposase